MIKISYADENESIFSITGQIEFIVFYDRIKHLIQFYNHTNNSYIQLLEQKESDLKHIQDNFDTISLYISNDDDLLESFTNDEIFEAYEEDIYSVRTHFLEFQKITLINVLYSEIEKLFDNLNDCLGQTSKKTNGLNQKIRSFAELIHLDNNFFVSTQNTIDELRKIRNKLVHSYDYWDHSIEVNGTLSYGLDNLNDNYLEQLINRIIGSIINLEEEYKLLRC